MGRAQSYEDPSSPWQISDAQGCVTETLAKTPKSRSNNEWNDVDKKAVTEELERLFNRQNETETVVDQLLQILQDLKGSIKRQVRDEMTSVVLTAKSTRQKAIHELAQELTKMTIPQRVEELFPQL